MGFSVREILSWYPLTKAVEVVKGGLPTVLPQEFFSLEEQVSGHQARTVEIRGTRRTARVVPYGSPAPNAERVTLSDRALVLLSAREQIQFRDELVFILRNWEEYTPQQQFAMREIALQGEQMRQRFENLEIAATLQTLAEGRIWFDKDGNLLPSSSGADLVIDQGVPSSNTGNLGGVISASWANSNTDIVSQIVNIKKLCVQRTGYRLKYAIYGANIPGYLAKNTQLQLFWARNVEKNREFLESGLLPRDFLGLIWIPAYEAFYEDKDGTVREIFDGDRVTFTPEITEATWAFYRGSELVPTTFGPMMDAEKALGSFREVFGRGRYAKILDNPVQIIDVGFSHFLPRMKVPEAFFLADVTP